MCLDLGKLN